MSVDVHAETVITCPRAYVADFVFDPKTEKLWIEGVQKAFPQSTGSFTSGARTERWGVLAGLQYACDVVVTRDDPGKMLEFSSSEPFEMKIKYTLEDHAEGTSIKIRIQSIGSTNRIAMPPAILSNKVKADIVSSLKKLKTRLEN
ncbi:MAG: hypothetical protein ABL984_02380 [Pyrinomonadaceae bacterium]